MTDHVVGIRVTVKGSAMQRGEWAAVCDTCGFTSRGTRDPKLAQQKAIEHRGGTYRVRERAPKPTPMPMDEMFPEAR